MISFVAFYLQQNTFFSFIFMGKGGNVKKKCIAHHLNSPVLGWGGGLCWREMAMKAGGPSLRDLQALVCRDDSGSPSFVPLLIPPLYSSLAGRGKGGPWVAHLQTPQKALWLSKELFDPRFVSRQQGLNTQMCV